VSARNLGVRSAYTAPAKLEASLQKGTALGLLEPLGEGNYLLTAAGRAGVQQLIETAYAAMVPLQPLPHEDLLRLAQLLQKVVEAALAAPEPPGKWCLRIARHYDPGPGAAVMQRIDQYLSDLAAYRDDAHLAAWRPYGVSGPAWEAFTLLWVGTGRTLDELCLKLARRGYDREEYAAALQELIDRDWIAPDAAGYAVTERGRTLRETVEATTDSYFHEPLQRLAEAEVAELRDALVRLRDALTHQEQELSALVAKG
jgi:hypothetical protein